MTAYPQKGMPMKLTDLTSAHVGQFVHIDHDHPVSHGILSAVRREDRPLKDLRLTGDANTRETWVRVEIEGQPLGWLRGRDHTVEIDD